MTTALTHRYAASLPTAAAAPSAALLPGAAPAPSTPALTSRRHIDLARVSSASCRF